ncbi:unnamed protein product [Leptidea sinapis]|uniref:Uncharacterized protein n=1 Tax=Leptidea sinapis TaxID=189913 RepID=A0A5E4QS41_9NEOP|nr:unnamed protein product [Leptidea sinapis]
MSKRRKKTKPERDKGESILDSTSESSEFSDSRTVLQDHEDFYLPFRVDDYCRRYPEDAGAGHEFIVFIESVTEQPLGSRDMLTLRSYLSRFIKGIKYLKKLNKYKIGVVFERPNLANTFEDNTTFLREQNIEASIPAGATELSGKSYNNFCSIILRAVENSVPKTNYHCNNITHLPKRKRQLPWWIGQCTKVVEDCKQAIYYSNQIAISKTTFILSKLKQRKNNNFHFSSSLIVVIVTKV